MPLYTYECVCGKQREVICSISERPAFRRCECGGKMRQVIVGGSTHIFGEQTFDDIAPTPITVRSKKELIQACRKHGCYARNYMEHYSPKERLIKWGGSDGS